MIKQHLHCKRSGITALHKQKISFLHLTFQSSLSCPHHQGPLFIVICD